MPALKRALTVSTDRFLEHALIHALHHLADEAALRQALEEPQPRVRLAALILLDQPPRPKGAVPADVVLRHVSASDPGLRQAALRVLVQHPEWGGQTLDLLQRWLEKQQLSAEERSALPELVLTFQRQPQVQKLIAAMVRGEILVERRVLLLETLARTSLRELPATWIDALAEALASGPLAVRTEAVRTTAVLQLAKLDDRLTQLVEERSEPVQLRLEALRGVVLRRPQLSPVAFALLMEHLGTKADPLARLAAVEILGRSKLTADKLKQVLATVRGDMLVAPGMLLPMLRRSLTDETAPLMVDYLTAALQGGWRPSEAELAPLLAALPASLHAEATTRLRELQRHNTEQQRSRLAELEPLLQRGDPNRGREVFRGKKVACSHCHRVGSEGGLIGPDLTRIGAIRTGRDLLESIILPSSTLAQGYETYRVEMADGRVLSWVIARRTADLVILRDSSGAEIRLGRDQVERLTRTPTSLMPDGLDRALSRDELHDLLAYVQGLR